MIATAHRDLLDDLLEENILHVRNRATVEAGRRHRGSRGARCLPPGRWAQAEKRLAANTVGNKQSLTFFIAPLGPAGERPALGAYSMLGATGGQEGC